MSDDAYSLDKLHGLVEPDPVAWWPPAVGWWFVLALAVVWAAAWSLIVWARWRSNAYRRAGLRELTQIESSTKSGTPMPHTLANLSSLLKRVALSAYRRERVASLSGTDWIAFLDSTSSEADFRSEPASFLASASYADSGATQVDAAQCGAICQTARTWIQTHEAEVETC